MSGGSYDYAYSKLERFIEDLRLADAEPATEERKRFAALLADVAVAMRAIEWVDSGDYAPGDEVDPIHRVLRHEDAIRKHKAEFERLGLNSDPADYDLWAVLS